MSIRQYRRSSLRVPRWDYSGYGWYHIVIRIKNAQRNFGFIRDGMMYRNVDGIFIEMYLQYFQYLYPFVQLDEFQIMPDHVHYILQVADGNDVPFDKFVSYGDSCLCRLVRPRKSLGRLTAALKTRMTRWINGVHHTQGEHVWQRNYYARIIQSDQELEQVRTYIRDNPRRWCECNVK